MNNKSFVNLDINAGCGVKAELWHYLEAVLKDCVNPSSVHQAGQKARYLIEETREDLKNLLGLGEARIIFTSGASEANNLILSSIFQEKNTLRDSHLILSAVEHMSLYEPAKKLESEGLQISWVKPSEKSAYKAEDFISCLKPSTKMLALMYANNETGEILPLAEVAAMIKSLRPDIFIFSDAVQALGKSEFKFSDLKLDAISISGHKIGALPGVGALIVKDDYRISPVILGGPQEHRFRAGTENLPGIVSFGYVARKIQSDLKARINRMSDNKERIKTILSEKIRGLEFNCFSSEVLPNTLNIRIPGVRSDDLVVALDLEGILVSSAAACSSGKPLPSHVLLSCGLTEEESRESIRISLSDEPSESEIKESALKIAAVVEHMRRGNNLNRVEHHAG
jgi:cysteine desulfurase